MAEQKVVYPSIQKETTAGSGERTEISDLLLRFVETRVSASEDRVMRHLAERTNQLEKDLSRQMTEVINSVNSFKPGATWWQNVLVVVGGIGIVFAVLAYASDRFDSGLNSMGAIEEALDAQRELNASQDQRLDRILSTLEVMNSSEEEESAP